MVRVVNLTKVFRSGVRAVDNISFTVSEGEIFGLIGPNGSGKTTTLRIMSTLLKPTSGDVFIAGYSIIKNPLEVRRIIGYLPEEAGAYKDLSGYDFIRLMLSLRFKGLDLEERTDEAISLSGLGEFIEKPIKTYSKGMKRMLALSVVLASHPRVLVLDEPTSGLDVEKSLQVRSIIRAYREKEKATIILSSHNMLEIETVCDRVALIYRGRIIAEGGIDYLKERFSARNLEEVFVKTVAEHGF
ncbi:ABC transporter ATP-binding protein [Thermogladius sp. 4427co]|uniref:ABC transporter ATP-binding protein n=1 Tax=Thermogladius sp. 4427co TaxID=3450718 RepID=UPI003F78E80F